MADRFFGNFFPPFLPTAVTRPSFSIFPPHPLPARNHNSMWRLIEPKIERNESVPESRKCPRLSTPYAENNFISTEEEEAMRKEITMNSATLWERNYRDSREDPSSRCSIDASPIPQIVRRARRLRKRLYRTILSAQSFLPRRRRGENFKCISRNCGGRVCGLRMKRHDYV